jgi:hypothetical protein
MLSRAAAATAPAATPNRASDGSRSRRPVAGVPAAVDPEAFG